MRMIPRTREILATGYLLAQEIALSLCCQMTFATSAGVLHLYRFETLFPSM